MDFEVHCMSILPTELSLFNCDKVKSVLQSIAPFKDQQTLAVFQSEERKYILLKNIFASILARTVLQDREDGERIEMQVFLAIAQYPVGVFHQRRLRKSETYFAKSHLL